MPWKTVLNTSYFWHVPSADKLVSGNPHVPCIIFRRLFCVFMLCSLRKVAGRCRWSFICLCLGLLFCDGPLETTSAVSSACCSLYPQSGVQGFIYGLVTQKRMITWLVFNLFPSKYSFHANTTSHCCHKVGGLVHLTMLGETSVTATFADKAKLLWTIHYLHNCGWGWFGPCLTDTWFELFSSTQCKCRQFLSAPSQTFNS